MTTESRFTTTSRKILPYTFDRMENGKIKISMLTGQTLIVSRDEAERILSREDLNMQRRRMYQAALAWDENQVQQ